MHKCTLRLTVCLAAMVAASATHAETAPAGIWIGQTGNVAVEITKCGDTLCGRVVRPKDGADNGSCGTPVANAKPAGKDKLDGGWVYDSGKTEKSSAESGTSALDKLKLLADMGAKLFSEPMVWKSTGDAKTGEPKKCDNEVAKAPAPPAPVDKKVAPAPVAAATPRVPAAKIAAPIKSTIQEPVREATRIAAQPRNCSKYFSQIGETLQVPCE